LDRVFTESEQAYATKNKNKTETLAGRFAAKEAVLKLLGTGWRGKIAWTDIEVVNDLFGVPKVNLTGEVERLVAEKKIGKISVSISHTGNFAMASAVAVRGDSEK